jgi:hypothetical protein
VFYLCVAAGSLPGKVCAVRTAGYRKTYKKLSLQKEVEGKKRKT